MKNLLFVLPLLFTTIGLTQSTNAPTETLNPYSQYNLIIPHGAGDYGVVSSRPPNKTINPKPSNGSTITPYSQYNWIQWDSGDSFVVGYSLYFGKYGNMRWIGYFHPSSWHNYCVGVLDYNTTYQWRCDAYNIYGATLGDVWTFTTIPQPPQ